MKTLVMADVHANAPAFEASGVYDHDPAIKASFKNLLRNGFDKDLLRKDIDQMSKNEEAGV